MFFKNKKNKKNYFFQKKFIKMKNEVVDFASFILNEIKNHKIQFILLNGEIGSGKTFLVKQISKILKEEDVVVSPTFNKMMVYNNFVHIDAYNLSLNEFNSYVDFFEDKIVIIEWSKNINFPFENYIEINIEFKNEQERIYEVCWKV